MPRLARYENKIITNTYHILLRGINKQDIFLDSNDKNKLWTSIKKAKDKYQFKLYAIVLMSNHVHLAIYDPNDEMSKIIHQICTSYAMYFNKKYERVGHVFQNRFKNICIDKESYLLNLVRYIHKNPEKDGICKMKNYNWSSYKDYINYTNCEITDIDFILKIYDEDRKKAINKFLAYHILDSEEYLTREFEFDDSFSDEEVCTIIKNKLKIDNILSIQNYNKKIRDDIIYKISRIYGVYPKQIARIIGLSVRNVQRIIREKEK